MDVAPRKDYSIGGSIGGGIIQGNPMGTRTGYFNPFKIVKKGLKKVANVAKQVVKSPIGKAALIGLGGAGLMGMGPLSGLGGIGARIGGLKSSLFGSIIPGVRAASMPGNLGLTGFTKTAGLLGKLGLTKGGGSMGITGLGKMLGAGGLLGYFTSKGASEEEAQSLAADVKRGAGMGFDQIQNDIAAYRGGGQDESQMAAKGYRFLTPKKFTQPLATGGRVGLQEGTDPRMRGNPAVMEMIQPGDDMRENRIMNPDVEDITDYSLQDKDLKAGASSIKVEGDVRPLEMKMASYEPGVPTTGDLYDMNNPDYKGINPKVIREFIDEGIPLGYSSPEEYFDDFYGPFSKKNKKEPTRMVAEIPKNLSAEDAVRTFELSEGRPPKNMQEVIEFFKNRKLSAMGGIMDMPTGNMRRNKAGIKEIDYRATGGFVPVGIKEKADDVPAMLSKNEFVMTADAVRGAGNGSIKKGAQRMYDLMKQNESKVV